MIRTLLFMLGLSVAVSPLYALPVSISVVDESGAPVEKAIVQFESFSGTPREFSIIETGADGTAKLEAEASKQFPTSLGRIVVLKQNFALTGGLLTTKAPLKITLLKGASLRGTVLDAEKKPVKGARISFVRVQNENSVNTPVLYDGPLRPRMATMSDENGAWQLDNLPASVSVYISVVAPGFAIENFTAKVGEEVKTQLRPGASIRGKLLGLDGKPLPNVRIYAQPSEAQRNLNSYSQFDTRADGSYDLDGLEAGTYNVDFHLKPEQDFIVPTFEEITLAVGDSKIMPDARAVEGVLIGGKVIEKGGKPVEGATIGAYGTASPTSNLSGSVGSASTDKNGFWKMRSLPGKIKVYVMGHPLGFLRDQQLKTPLISAQGNQSLNFELERAPKITGKIVDETGKGVAARLIVQQNYDEWPVVSDETGNFEVSGPKAGEVEFGFSRWETIPNNDWDIAGNAKRTIPSPDPVEIKLAKTKLGRFEVRVYDDGDVALQGVKVTVYVWNGTGDNTSAQPREVESDKDGLVKIEGVRASQRLEIASANKAGYDLISKLSVEQKDGFTRGADIVLKKRSGKVTGQVFNSKGEVAAAVKVFAGGAEIVADENGKFVLEQLPDGKVDVVAYKDGEFALVSTDKEARLELKKPKLQNVDKPRAIQILDEVREQSKDTKYWYKDALQLVEPANFDAAADKVKAAKGENGGYAFVMRYAKDSSIEMSSWISLLASYPKASTRLYMSSMLAYMRGKIQDNEATHNWLNSLKADAAEVIAQNDVSDKWLVSIGLFGVASVADRIGDVEASDKAFLDAIAYVLKNFADKSTRGNPSKDGIFGVSGELISSSPRLLNKLLEQVEPESESYSRILQEGSPQIARNIGLNSAVPFLEKLRNAPTPTKNEEGHRPSIEPLHSRAVIQSIELGGKSNPALALKLAKELAATSDYGSDAFRDRALAEAAFFQEKSVAEALWRASVPRLEASGAMKIVARIALTDEKLARELYEATGKKLDADTNPYFFERNLGAFAFYEAQLNPAMARYRLEREFVKAKKDPNQRHGVGELVRAMSVFDAAHALEWANTLDKDENNGFAQFEAKKRIAQWLGADESVRAKAGFTEEGRQEWDF